MSCRYPTTRAVSRAPATWRPFKEAGEQTPAAQLDEPLGLLLGQRRQPLPDAGCEDQPDHGFGFRVCSSSNWSSSCLVFIFFTRSSYPVCWITRLNWVR